MLSLTLATIAVAFLFVLKGAAVLWGGKGVLDWVEKFIYNRAIGILLWAVAVGWTLWEVSKLGPSDFGNFKTTLFVVFTALGVLSVWFIPDYLMVRAWCVLNLYGSWWNLKAAFLQPEWTRLVFVATVYLMIVASLYFTVAPWRIRDILEELKHRPRATVAVGFAYLFWGLLLIVIAATYRFV